MSSSSRELIWIAAFLLGVPASALAQSHTIADAPPAGYHPGPRVYYEKYMDYPDWFDRRYSVTLQFGDAVAANQAKQMVDPWPPYVYNRNSPFCGQVISRAIDGAQTDSDFPPPIIDEE